jgi:uncharacterized protein (DUF1330 family)
MSAYLVVDIDVTNPEVYEEYKLLAPPAIAAYGGRYLARGGKSIALEGEWQPARLVILEFESLERLQEWYDSPEYREARRVREGAASMQMVALEGLG